MGSLIRKIGDAYRRHRKVAAYAVLGVLLGVGAYLAFERFVATPVYAPTIREEATTTPQATRYLLPQSVPMRLIIPKLDIDAEFEAPLSLNADKTVGVPKEYTTVGWYDGSPTPGSLGPSIILGHVDSYEGPAVFYHLGKLEPGDTFTIEREDGTKPTFVVDKLERYPQSDFPTDLVYGPIDHAGIRLITCTGTYNKGTLRYSHNLVVYGRLVDLGAASSTPTTE